MGVGGGVEVGVCECGGRSGGGSVWVWESMAYFGHRWKVCM